MRLSGHKPRAIAMWDFSWIERRWPGAGYEDWDDALGGLAERGYDAVRIDAFPHLVSAGPERRWTLQPVWNQADWGAPADVQVTLLPALTEFIAKAKAHGIVVGLSSWYRKDSEETRLKASTPEAQAQIWIDTVRHIERAGLLDQILYVDFCNEFPLSMWAPFYYGAAKAPEASRTDPQLVEWMARTTRAFKTAFPDIDCTFSFSTQLKNWPQQDVSMLDFIEPHVWMASRETSDFYDKVNYHHEMFDPIGFVNLVSKAEAEYRANSVYYEGKLRGEIDNMASWSRATGKPLVTTECWALIDYKDWPGLDWGWIKDLAAMGVEHAAKQGRWVAIATSNFCGPQFRGMWRDIVWHQRLTELIKTSSIDPDLKASS